MCGEDNDNGEKGVSGGREKEQTRKSKAGAGWLTCGSSRGRKGKKVGET